MNAIEVNTITKDGIKSVIRNTYAKMNAGEIDTATGEAVLDVLCTTHGTEYIASIFVEMTKEGWQG